MEEHERAVVFRAGREVAEMAEEARRRRVFVEPGAATPSGWRVLARALLSDEIDARQDLWAVQAPDPEGRVAFFATGAFLPLVRTYSWSEVERLRDVCRARAAETEALLAAAARMAVHGGGGRRVVEADWLRPTRRGEARRGAARIRLFDGQPVEAQGVVLLGPGGEVEATGIQARRLSPTAAPSEPEEAAELLLARSVWLRPLGDSRTWRRGRLRLESERAIFADEPHAEDGTRGEPLRFGLPGGAAAPDALETDLLGSALVGDKAAAGGVYAALLAAALRGGVRWRRHRDGALSSGGGHARPLGAFLTGMTGGEDERCVGGLPASAIDEVVLTDLRILGWEPLR